MRRQRESEQGSQQIKMKTKKQDSQNNESQQSYLDDDDPVNCPLIFKSVLLTLITIGILAFIITFATQVQQSQELYPSDFALCSDSSNVRRVNKYYAYEKMILGLSISGLVLAFGITVFLIRHAYDFCRCFDDCCGGSADDEQEESRKSQSEEDDVEEFQNQLKKRIQSNIVVPKSQMQTNEIVLPSKSAKPKEKEPKIMVRNRHIRKYLRPVKQIKQIDKEYNQNGGNSDQIDCNCECNSIGQCLACFAGCLWCRTCFDAHHYRFYKTKNQEYTYWILYMVKTLFFGTALAYVIRINVALNELDYCSAFNAKKYNDALYTAMVIGIITVCLDVFGYVHLLIEGSLLEVIEDTLNEPRKSQHSQNSDSEEESETKDKKKKPKKYKGTESDDEQDKTQKTKKKTKKSSEDHQSQQSYEIPTKLNLVSSIKKDKPKIKNEPQQKLPPSSRDTDSFFIKIKTLGNKYIDDIEDGESEESKQKPIRPKNKREVSESEQSYEIPNKKPDIFVPKDLDNLPRFEKKKTGVMIREEKSVSEQPFWKNQLSKKTQPFGGFRQLKDSQMDRQEFGIKKSQEQSIPQPPSGSSKFGVFNRAPQEKATINKDFVLDEKDNKGNKFQQLSKLSTKF